MSIIIRPFREADRASLRAMTAQAFDGVSIDQNIDRILGPVGLRDWQWRKGHHVDHDLEAIGGEIAVAEETEAKRAVGYVSMRIDRDAGVGYIPNLVVEAHLRGQGLGRRLIEHALARFEQEGLSIARIETLDQNPIGSYLYPALGFREVARQIHFAMPLPRRHEEGGA